MNFTTEQATGAKATRGYVRNPDPAWVREASDGGSIDPTGGSVATSAPRRSAKPPLRIAIDTGYDQDSQRAVRSVAKQLAECIGVKRRALKVETLEDGTDEHAKNPPGPRTVATDANPGGRGSHLCRLARRRRGARGGSLQRRPMVRGAQRPARRRGHIHARHSWRGGADGGADGAEGGVAPAKVVYLSPDAEEVLEDVEPGVVYVIGGIVDLAARGVAWSLPKANALGACARRLPVREHLPLVTNQILNIDTAMKVLCERYSGKEWGDALRAALPRRQQGERPARFNRPKGPREMGMGMGTRMPRRGRCRAPRCDEVTRDECQFRDAKTFSPESAPPESAPAGPFDRGDRVSSPRITADITARVWSKCGSA